jgi:hypothetical protein
MERALPACLNRHMARALVVSMARKSYTLAAVASWRFKSGSAIVTTARNGGRSSAAKATRHSYQRNRETGFNVIAIGGDKLSLGLTLEGLSVSYFLRASRMCDTLMQMGRWFGYRPGYLDLCRLYTTPDLEDWFQHIAEASEELRREFDHMVAVGGTRRDYGHHGDHRAAAAAYAPYDAALFRSRLHQIESASPPFLMIKSAT